MKNLFTACVLCTLFCSSSAQAVSEISIKAERVEHPQADVQKLAIKLNFKKADVHNKADAQLNVSSTVRQKSDKDWAKFNLNCELHYQQAAIQCADGLLKSERLNVPFSIDFSHFYPARMTDVDAVLRVRNASFSDEAGLHAAEKLSGSLAVSMKESAGAWLWHTALDWQTGEVFWQPFYIANGGHQLTADGKLADELLTVDRAHASVKDAGELNASGVMRLSDFKLLSLNASLPNLNLNAAYPMFFKPMLDKTSFADAEVSGVAALRLEIANAEPKLVELSLKDVNIADKNGKFAFYKINASIPWSYDEAKAVSFGYESGELLNLPLGRTSIQAQLDRYSLTAPAIRLPILDGAFDLANVSAARRDGQWYWHLSARLEPIAMEDFSSHLKLPRMSGKASAEIPLVTYAAGNLSTDGSLLLNIFNGTAKVTGLAMQSPLGVAPKLSADIALRNLDLGVLTSTFSFGAIEGKLDGDIQNLELQNWKPVKFDAIVQSSPGKYPKKISQRAVENISALGGGGAAAAVQRSFLRFFEQFNYGKMGLSCRLRNDVCEMGGIESTQHGYVIVKGSGIPAITVMGYNQSVGWSELLARIKRVTDGNSKAVVK